eukprot:Awhi_evm1s10046
MCETLHHSLAENADIAILGNKQPIDYDSLYSSSSINNNTTSSPSSPCPLPSSPSPPASSFVATVYSESESSATSSDSESSPSFSDSEESNLSFKRQASSQNTSSKRIKHNVKPSHSKNFEDYTVGRNIGYTNLYEGQHTPTGQSVSLQVLDLGPEKKLTAEPNLNNNNKKLEQLENELKALNTLGWDEGVLNIVDSIETYKKIVLIKEPCSIDLHAYLRQVRRLPEEHAKEYFSQVVRTVVRCHASNIVIRDLKLNSIAFASPAKTVVKITSFHLARTVTDANDLIGDQRSSPAYVAPEILSGQLYSGKAADIWSLGVILYALLVGTYPFVGDTPQKLFSKITSGTFSFRSFVSPKARRLLEKMLSIDPLKRPTAEEILMHDWLEDTMMNHHNNGDWGEDNYNLIMTSTRETAAHFRYLESFKRQLTDVEEDEEFKISAQVNEQVHDKATKTDDGFYNSNVSSSSCYYNSKDSSSPLDNTAEFDESEQVVP